MKRTLGVVLFGVCFSCLAVPAALVRSEYVTTVTGKSAIKCVYSAGMGSEVAMLSTKRDQYGNLILCPPSIEVE